MSTHTPAPHIAHILELLGPNTVLLHWPLGSKGTKKRWKHISQADMANENYLRHLEAGNIGVALGEKSSDLCSIDIDEESMVEAFFALNPALENTLYSRGRRGCNVWVRMKGRYPKTCILQTTAGEKWGEFRSEGGQTIIHGTHPSGCQYWNNGKPVQIIEFENLNWPTGTIPLAIQPSLTIHHPTEETEESEVAEVAEVAEVSEELKSCAFAEFVCTVQSMDEAIEKAIATKTHKNNESLFTLARGAKALELKMGKLDLAGHEVLFNGWYEISFKQGLLRVGLPRDDYWIEYLNAVKTSKFPLGSVAIAKALHRIKTANPPPEADLFPSTLAKELITLCWALQMECLPDPFYLSSRLGARILNHHSHQKIATHLGAFVTAGILSIAIPGNSVRATRYWFVRLRPNSNGC